MHPDVLRVRSFLSDFYVLRDGSSLYLIDSGFVGGVPSLRRALHSRGWQGLKIRGIFLTHGHLDHTLNVAQIKRETGAWVAVSENDVSHCHGEYRYCGLSVVCGALESLGRKLLRYEKFAIDHIIRQGEPLGVWGDLTAIVTPGHTLGHMCFYSESRRILFSGDMFASYSRFSHQPPGILNVNSRSLGESRKMLLDLDLAEVYPHHSDGVDGEIHLERFRALDRQLMYTG